jgi:uncharacterized protein YbjT (DUF2867 family)
MEHVICVLGGTGLLGVPVVRRLRSDGFRVRVLTRGPDEARRVLDPSIEIAAGDATDPTVLRSALEGCHAVHISIAGSAERPVTEAVAALADDVGLDRVGYVSGSTVDEKNRWFPMVDAKLRAEQAVAGCGVPWTVFRPTWPFETLARFVRDGRATVIGRNPTPYHWFAAADHARMVSTAYRLEEAAGRVFYIHGPEAMPIHEAVDRYREALHPEIASTGTMPTWMARALATVTRNQRLRFAADLMAYFDRVGEPGDPADANRLLGTPTTTMSDWLAGQRKSQTAGR